MDNFLIDDVPTWGGGEREREKERERDICGTCAFFPLTM